MKEIFYTKLDAYLSALSVKRRSKYLITAETYDKVSKVLKNEKKYDPSFNFWAKRRFTVVTFGDHQTIYCQKEKLPIVTISRLSCCLLFVFIQCLFFLSNSSIS